MNRNHLISILNYANIFSVGGNMEEYINELNTCNLDIFELKQDFNNSVRLFIGNNTRKIVSIESRFNDEYLNRTFINKDNDIFSDIIKYNELKDICLSDDEALSKLQSSISKEDYIKLGYILNNRTMEKINSLRLKML